MEPRRSFRFAHVLTLVFAAGVGAFLTTWAPWRNVPRRPEAPLLIERIREVARLETLEVSLHRKVSFAPDPPALATDGFWSELTAFAQHALRNPNARAILFADVHLTWDLSKLGPDDIAVKGDVVHVRFPQLQTHVEMRPDETEIIGSNLNSAETAEMFAKAQRAFAMQTQFDPQLRGRAERSAQQALRALLLPLGFRDVVFVAEKPIPPPS
ncbi:MAG: DUF4230 domain-containing protein [Myxococcaceae bacterium]